jgi:hypothetical protein
VHRADLLDVLFVFLKPPPGDAGGASKEQQCSQ